MRLDCGTAITNADFHANAKKATMADETSMSHYLRSKTKLLKGRSYGESFHRGLKASGLVSEGTSNVFEVGGGLGDLAAALVPYLAKGRRDMTYTMVEVSPALEIAQKKATEGLECVRHLRGDAQRISELVADADLIIANEVIADFDAAAHVPLKRGGEPTGRLNAMSVKPEDESMWDDAWDMIEKYWLEIPKPEDVFNYVVPTGQMKFVEEVGNALNPGGACIITEHSSKYPRLVPCRGHTEVSMSIPYLERAAQINGMNAASGSLADFIDAKADAEVVDESWVNFILNFGVEDVRYLKSLEERYEAAWGKLMRNQLPGEYPPFDALGKSGKKRLAGLLASGAGPMLAETLETPYLLMERRWDGVSENPKNKSYDLYLSPDEFETLRGKNGWDNPLLKKPKTTMLGVELSEFSYLILRKA